MAEAMAEKIGPQGVLVVDDDPAVRDVFVRMLRCRYDVTSAGSIAEALDRVRRRRPRVVILDLGLGAEDGRDLLRDLVTTYGHDAPAVVICSGSEGELPAGATAMLPKPFALSALIELLRELTDDEAP